MYLNGPALKHLARWSPGDRL